MLSLKGEKLGLYFERIYYLIKKTIKANCIRKVLIISLCFDRKNLERISPNFKQAKVEIRKFSF